MKRILSALFVGLMFFAGPVLGGQQKDAHRNFQMKLRVYRLGENFDFAKFNEIMETNWRPQGRYIPGRTGFSGSIGPDRIQEIIATFDAKDTKFENNLVVRDGGTAALETGDSLEKLFVKVTPLNTQTAYAFGANLKCVIRTEVKEKDSPATEVESVDVTLSVPKSGAAVNLIGNFAVIGEGEWVQ